MNKFAKTLLAAAQFAGAGAANASIAVTGTNDSSREMYMQAYDAVQKKTYSLDLGITLATVHANRTNAGYELSFDLSTDSNWLAFTSLAAFNPTATSYYVAVGRSSKVYASQKVGNVLPEYADTT